MAERVMRHVSAAPYTLGSAEFAAFGFGHPLEEIRSEAAYREIEVRDWFPEFAMVHLFHFALERKGGLFSYAEFRDFCKTDEDGQGFSRQAQDKVRELVSSKGCTLEAAVNAMKWRVGNGYYSFLRELYLVARLREAGLDARIHPLADALFRVDAWCGRTTVEMYVANRTFKDGRDGRKPHPETYLGDQEAFSFVRLEMQAQHAFGKLHLPTGEEVGRCIAELRKSPGTGCM
ncbi:hypothetical protein [Streptomyces rimosus]|uniref:hypothetical protein n=1 Tax=Streptomyces rimosus TaxID=1927 RepID=UPI000B1D10B9|nr:hypothetical protein [Streptomyces rimosus]